MSNNTDVYISDIKPYFPKENIYLVTDTKDTFYFTEKYLAEKYVNENNNFTMQTVAKYKPPKQIRPFDIIVDFIKKTQMEKEVKEKLENLSYLENKDNRFYLECICIKLNNSSYDPEEFFEQNTLISDALETFQETDQEFAYYKDGEELEELEPELEPEGTIARFGNLYTLQKPIQKAAENGNELAKKASNEFSGFNGPIMYSDQACDFFSVPRCTIGSRTQFVRYVNEYTRRNELRNKTNTANARQFNVDKPLKQLLGDHPVYSFFRLPSMIAPHISKIENN